MTASTFVPCPRCRGTAILKELADAGRVCAFCERELEGKQSSYREGRAAPPSYTQFDRSSRPNA
jgi:hypothetical protein